MRAVGVLGHDTSIQRSGCTTKVTGSRLDHLSASDLGRRSSRLASVGSRLASVGRLASFGPRGHCASGPGRGLHRRTSGRRGSGPRPSCRPTPDPTTGRGTSDNPGRAQVGLGRRQPPRTSQALNRRSLRRLMLRCVRCFSSRSITRFSANEPCSAPSAEHPRHHDPSKRP